MSSRLASSRRSDLTVAAVVTLALLCVSSPALAGRAAETRPSPAVSFPYRVTSAQSLTLQLARLTATVAHHRRPPAVLRRRFVSLSKARARAVTALAARDPDLALR